MTKLIRQTAITAAFLLAVICLQSCSENYPQYSLTTIRYVPDSLKAKHREFITETVRAASQHMTGGDYEDVDKTIYQANCTADRCFEISVIGLEKKTNEHQWFDIKPSEFNTYEKYVFDSLQNTKTPQLHQNY